VYNYELQIGGITPVVSWFLQWSCPTRNPDGILAVDRMMGQIGLWVLPGTLAGSVTVGRTDTIARRSITAHQESVVALALDASGNTLATGSSRGTVIRLWDTETGHQLRELRRGLMGTRLYGLGLSTAGEYLVATSAHGTLHWFAARSLQPNVRSWIGSLTTEWSRAQYSITRGWHQAQIHQGEAGCIIRVFSDGGWTALLVRESSDTPNDTISEIAKR
jgi:hypothetical protein